MFVDIFFFPNMQCGWNQLPKSQTKKKNPSDDLCDLYYLWLHWHSITV